MKLKKFQKQFIAAVENPAYDTVILSGPRSLGKSFIAAHILTRCFTPGDPLHQPGKEYLLGAASLGQARLTFKFIKDALEANPDYRWVDGQTRLGATHLPSDTKLRAISSNAKTSFGLVNVPLVVIDEPGGLEIVGGQMLADSLFTAQSKVGSPLKLVLIGTLAPMAVDELHWWHQLAHGGTHDRVHAQMFQGQIDGWDNWQTIRKANPLVSVDPVFRRGLLAERDAARGDTRLKARFLSYRLNIPSGDESTVLLTVDDWERVKGREVPEREGRPLVGLDLGNGRAFSAAVAMWQNGRTEAIAVCPGLPTLPEIEKRDRVPAGTYQTLVDMGLLIVDDGRRVQQPRTLVDAVHSEWGSPAAVVCDRFRLADLEDCGLENVAPRVSQWREASEDVRATRMLARDGPMACSAVSAPLVAASLAVAMVKNDTTGNHKIVKRAADNSGRDDIAWALHLVAGEYARRTKDKAATRVYSGKV